MLLHFVCTLEGPAVKSHDECILFFSFSESLSYHIIIPAEMGVNSMTFSCCLSLSNINNVLRGLHTSRMA
ncbi:Uncharacterized protein APZ42_031066 [Daphnia magna]|uniref:Uncharacterized protein n=1 Tax=Daphnia magna TaxID=35525 RepID=A0A0P5XPG7_9CRUS|nr:Uncharacterized protein APZ42_031066 [Daphnia magna]